MICGGGHYITQTWVIINVLRAVESQLPIELWIVNGEELHADLVPHLDRLGVSVRNLDHILDRFDDSLATRVRGYALKVP